MAIDINEGYTSIQDSITKNKIYKQVSQDYKNLKKKAGKSFEKNKKKVTKTLSTAKSEIKKFQKKQGSQLDELLNIKFLSAGEQFDNIMNTLDPNKLKKYQKGGETQKYIIEKFITALNELKPKLLELMTTEVLNAAGCSQDQVLTPNTNLYLNVKSIDFAGLLKIEPDSNVGKISYEQENVSIQTKPFAMNKELYNRIQNINQNYSTQYGQNFKGESTQDLFDIRYVDIDNLGNPGDYYEVVLQNRVTGNKAKEFLQDYYKTIDVIDFKGIFANLMNLLTGAISIEKGDGKSDIEGLEKIFLIIQRILGLCFDSTKEIDVSGTAKVSENDNVDDSFFEFTEIDLNFIDQRVSDILLGVVEFEDCDNIKLPINSSSVVSAIDELIFVPGSNNNNSIKDSVNITDSITKNPDWLPLQINLDLEFIKEFPKAVLLTLLSPKTLLPLAIVLKSLGNNILDNIKSYIDFAKNFKQFFINVVSKIGGIFVKIIFDLIKQDILQLIKTITLDIKNEKVKKILAIILTLTQVITTVAKLIKDFRECKSVIDELLQLLKLASQGFGNQVPLPLLLATRFLSGYSSTRAYLNIIGEFEKLGIPTGPMPDGSPNKFMAAVKAVVDGMDQEEAENGQVQIAVDFLSVTPIGTTIPKVVYGKKI